MVIMFQPRQVATRAGLLSHLSTMCCMSGMQDRSYTICYVSDRWNPIRDSPTMLRGVKHASMRMIANDNEENLKYEKKRERESI